MDIRRFFCVQTSTKNSDSNAGSSKKSSEKAAGGKSGKSKETAKRRISKSSESEEDRKHKNKRKKSKVIVETDSEEEPLPTKIRKKDSGRKKNDIRISSDEEDALPQRLQKTAKNEPQKKKPLSKPKAAEVTPAKRVTTASEYFGAKPIERSSKKTQKRKERPQEVSEECAVVESNNNSEPTTNHLSHENELPSEKPSKKAKKCLLEDTAERATKVEDKIDFSPKKSPSLTPKKSKSSQNRKQATSKSETPGKSHNSVSASKEMSKTSNKNKTRKTVTPEKQKAKEMSPKSGNKTTECKQRTSKKNITPEKVTSAKSKLPVPTADDKKATPNGKIATKKDQVNSTPSKNENKHLSEDVVPSSLERKASGYRSFMMREGPQALGSKEIPRGSETCLEGKVFVISGILESIEREDAVDLIKRHGGKVTQAVSKKTSYLVVGRDPGMSKIEKAEKFGTKQIDDDGLFKMIRASQPTATKPDLKEKQSNFNDESSIDLESSQFTEESESQASVDQTQSHGGHSQSSVFSSSACSTPSTKTPISSPLPAGKARDSLLWVDKYKPTSIKDIVGQKGDKGNVKKLLRWLQNWRENNQKSTKPKGGYFAGKEDGSIFKAALLSGPPGVGKTTSAHLVCKEAGFSFVEFNASDSRSKKTLEQQISELLDNKTMDGYFGAAAGKSSGTKHALVMDEVDGMAGNEDRGGMQELINLIKSTKIPIICMCNDRNSQKVRSLANYCFDLRFHRPRVDQLKAAMMSIAFKEQLKISPQAMEKIVVGANQDVRQVLYNLSMWTSKQKSISYDEAKADADRAHKDIKIGPFDVTRKIFSAEESSKMKIQDQFSLFFNDYSLIPLFSQENYLQVVPYRAGGDLKKTLKCVSDAAESYCHSDLVEKSIRSNGSWNLLPLQAFFSCVYPGAVMRGRMSQRIDFPCWLGKNSTTTKNSRILQDLVSHAQLSISGSKNELNLEYIPHLRNVLSRPLINATSEDCSSKVSEVIDVMDSYHFVKDDWDNIMDVGYYDGKRKLQGDIDSKVKSAFTRTYNKASHLTPYAMNVGAKKTKKSAVDLETEGLGTGDTPEVSDDDSNEEIDQSFKVKKSGKTGGKKSGNAPAGTSSKQARGKGSGKSRDKTKK